MRKQNIKSLHAHSVTPRFLVFFTLIVFLCSSLFGNSQSQSKIKITTSVFPLLEFAKYVSGERGEVSLLLPPGAEIHTWRPRPSDILKVFSSDVFVYIGVDLEPWIDDILRGVDKANLHVLRASDGVELLHKAAIQEEVILEDIHNSHLDEHSHGALDPHIWLDFSIDQIIIDNIVSLLSQIEPQSRSYFVGNGAAYKKELADLDRQFRDELDRCKSKTFILGGHAAFGYMAQRYNLRQIALYGVNPKSSPTPKQLVRVVETAKKHHIKTIFFEVYVSDDLAKVIAEEVGAKTLVLNPAANLTREQVETKITFLEIMEKNLINLKKGLSGECF